jgi:hypothetical protein
VQYNIILFRILQWFGHAVENMEGILKESTLEGNSLLDLVESVQEELPQGDREGVTPG